MSYLFGDHQRALAPLLFPDTDAGSGASRKAAVVPQFGAPAMVPVHKPVSELTIALLVSLGARIPGQVPLQRTNDLSYSLIPPHRAQRADRVRPCHPGTFVGRPRP
jgi:hypothetical protein